MKTLDSEAQVLLSLTYLNIDLIRKTAVFLFKNTAGFYFRNCGSFSMLLKINE